MKPNLLVLMFDQMAPQSLPVYGHPLVRTPCLESLAERGAVFDSAYCNSPLCAPSRFSMMAGRLPSAIGAYDNAAYFPADVPTFAHYLRAAGYRTCLAGKMHFVGPDQLHGFEERVTTDVYPADFGWTADWEHPEKRYFWMHNMQSVVEAGVYARTLNIDYDEEVRQRAERWIYDAARDDDPRPFLLVVSFIHPHDPYMTPERWWSLYPHEAIDLPRVSEDPFGDRDPHSQRLRYICQMERYRMSEARVRNARHAYYGMLSWADDQAAGVLAALSAAGLDQRTAVVATADHGDMLGERGLWYKMSFYERSARVPLIVAGPELPRGRRLTENVSLVDLLPTLAELAGAPLEPAAPLDGRSLVPLLERGDGWPDTVLGEYLAEGTSEPLLMVRRGRYKYVSCRGDPPQLFDLAADPDELENLAGGAAHAEAEAALAAECAGRWDAHGLREAVIASQRRRLFLHRALRAGRQTPWDYAPPVDPARLYNRNYGDELYDTDRRARIPRREPPPVESDEAEPGARGREPRRRARGRPGRTLHTDPQIE